MATENPSDSQSSGAPTVADSSSSSTLSARTHRELLDLQERTKRWGVETKLTTTETPQQEKLDKAAALFPLRQVPQGGERIGYVEVPLTSSEIRSMREQLPKLQEDPEGFIKKVDGLLGPSLYTPSELLHISRQLTNNEVVNQGIEQARKLWIARGGGSRS